MRDLLKRLAHFGRRLSLHARSAAEMNAAAERLISEGNRAEKDGRLREACELYRKAVDAAPGYAKAHLNLGIGLEAIGDADGGIAAYEAALGIDAADAYANYNLGKLLFTRGALSRAEQLLAQALRSRPDFPEAHIVLACVLKAHGQLEAAASSLARVSRQWPDDFGAQYRCGCFLKDLGSPAAAESALRRATQIDPANADARYELATLLMARDEMQQAELHLRAALTRQPAFVEAHAALFHVLDAKGDLAGASAELDVVLQQRPDWAHALYEHDTGSTRMETTVDGQTVQRQVIGLNPRFFIAYRILGGVLHREGRIAEMLEFCRAGRARHPERFDLESLELFLLNFADDISAEALFGRHQAFGERLESACRPQFDSPREATNSERRLRVGYVSGDFNYHPVGQFTVPVFERHDRSQFEVFCYATSQKADGVTRQLSARADVWRDVPALSDVELAETIHHDRIDVLIDLAGHSGISRLGVFARQPAPVQATWLGYLNTTGLRRIRYRITDSYCDPPDAADRLHTEALVRLPHSQWCYRPFISLAAAQTPPSKRNGYVTFGSFNQAAKLSRSTRRLWAQILNQLPQSRLIVLGVAKGRAQDELLQDLASAGVAAARIAIVPFVPEREYFQWFNEVDIALDTMPYSGGTTTCDALWMGVPVVTAPGSRTTSRSAASVLTSVGLPGWIAPTAEQYVDRAVEFAGEYETLADLRISLRGRMRASPLMDEERFTRDLETAYRQMWRHWCASSEHG